MTTEKKSLFDKAIDALTDRDEKAAAEKAAAEKARTEAQLEAARKEAAALRAKMEAEKAAAAKATAEKAAAEKAAAERAVALKAAAERAAAARAAAAPKKGIVTTRSLRVRKDHNTTSEVVAGLVDGQEIMILATWSDGKNMWAQLDNGWAAITYGGETYIKLA